MLIMERKVANILRNRYSHKYKLTNGQWYISRKKEYIDEQTYADMVSVGDSVNSKHSVKHFIEWIPCDDVPHVLLHDIHSNIKQDILREADKMLRTYCKTYRNADLIDNYTHLYKSYNRFADEEFIAKIFALYALS